MSGQFAVQADLARRMARLLNEGSDFVGTNINGYQPDIDGGPGTQPLKAMKDHVLSNAIALGVTFDHVAADLRVSIDDFTGYDHKMSELFISLGKALNK